MLIAVLGMIACPLVMCAGMMGAMRWWARRRRSSL